MDKGIASFLGFAKRLDGTPLSLGSLAFVLAGLEKHIHQK